MAAPSLRESRWNRRRGSHDADHARPDRRVAATNTPIIFIGTGEHLHDLEKFAPQPFISKMLGMGDMQGLVERAQEMAMANPERQENMMKKLEKGEFTIRDLKEQLNTVMGMCVFLVPYLAGDRERPGLTCSYVAPGARSRS